MRPITLLTDSCSPSVMRIILQTFSAGLAWACAAWWIHIRGYNCIAHTRRLWISMCYKSRCGVRHNYNDCSSHSEAVCLLLPPRPAASWSRTGTAVKPWTSTRPYAAARHSRHTTTYVRRDTGVESVQVWWILLRSISAMDRLCVPVDNNIN